MQMQLCSPLSYLLAKVLIKRKQLRALSALLFAVSALLCDGRPVGLGG